jgi:hypothetical protein
MTLQEDPDRRPDPKIDGEDRTPLGWVLAVVVLIAVAIGGTLMIRGNSATTEAPSAGARSPTR